MIALYYILWTLSIALKLSILRWVEILLYHPPGMTWRDIFLTAFYGFRFDMMIVGFWLAPVVAYLVLSQVFLRKAIAHPRFVKTYFALSWLFLCSLYLKDLISFPTTHDRLWKPDHLAHLVINPQYVHNLEWWYWIVIAILILGLLKVGFSKFEIFTQRFQKMGFLALVFIFLWTVLISRGTLTQQHLRRNDCQFSKSTQTEALCLNPLFTFTKNK